METTRRTMLMAPMALAAAAASGTAMPAAAQTAMPASGVPGVPLATIDLWPNGVKGQLHPDLVEVIEETSHNPAEHNRRAKGISKPRMAVFPAANPTGGAMVIIPGGGFSWNYFDHEGYRLADALNAQGITCFVLFYRLANDGWSEPATVALADAQRAMRLAKANAARFRFSADRVGVIGFSAGGFLTATMATRHATPFYAPVDSADSLSARPFLAAPIYPVQSADPAVAYSGLAPSLFGGAATPAQIATFSPDRNVGADASPVFLAHAEPDDVVPVGNSTQLRDALKAKNILVETHLFADGGHGFGMRPDLDQPYHVWPQLFIAFARRRGLMG